MILNGTPEDYGLDGLVPGVSFSTIDYAAQGKASGEELGNCINERYDGKAEVLFAESAPGTAGKEELETAVKEALAATAPDAEIVSHHQRQRPHRRRRPTSATRSRATRTSPPSSARTTRARSARSARSRPPARTFPASPRPAATRRSSQAVEAGDIYAVVALQFEADMAQSFDALTAMIDDPSGHRRPADRSAGSRQGRRLTRP